ncbi:MAG: hypothetical protein PVF51_12160, partial [Nitrospirota bacterium]
GRKNVTFAEPEGGGSRLIHTVMPRLLFLPYSYRNMVQRMLRALAQTMLAFLCYGLAWFSGTTGLTTIANTPVLDWLSLLLLFYLFTTWWGTRNPLARSLQKRVEVTGIGTLVVLIPAAVLLPFGLAYVHYNVHALPAVPFASGGYILLVTVLAGVATLTALLLVAMRTRQVNPVTEVAEFRDNWQESVHPQEIFINFEDIVMANRRYKEVPNRVYNDEDAVLIEEGSDDKGSFKGEMIMETQPIVRAVPVPRSFRMALTGATVGANVLLVLAAFWLYRLIGEASAVERVTEAQAAIPLAVTATGTLLTAFILWLFGNSVANHAHAFWSEMQFESLLVFFQCRGTYTESKVSTGASIYDSTRSENVVARSSMTLWVLTSSIVSSCFTASGSRNLEFPRFVLEMHRADDDLRAIIGDLRGFLDGRESIARVDRDKDVMAASQIYHINKQSRGSLPAGDKAAATQLDFTSGGAYTGGNGSQHAMDVDAAEGSDLPSDR